MTIIHEKGSELHWKDVRELVVGAYIPSLWTEPGSSETMLLHLEHRDCVADGPGECRLWRIQRPSVGNYSVFSAPALGLHYSSKCCFAPRPWEWSYAKRLCSLRARRSVEETTCKCTEQSES